MKVSGIFLKSHPLPSSIAVPVCKGTFRSLKRIAMSFRLAVPPARGRIMIGATRLEHYRCPVPALFLR